MSTVDVRLPTIARDFASVRVYRLAPPVAMHRNARLLARELFGMEELSVGRRTFSVHPTSGYLSYADEEQLWKTAAGHGLPLKSEVERHARRFVEEANKKVAGNASLRREGITSIFPSDLRRTRIGGVVRKGDRQPDHWQCEFGVYLPADSRRAARVEGAIVDVRIGRGGRIIGLTSRWRPVVGDVLSDERSGDRRAAALHADASGAIRQPTPAAPPEMPKRAGAEKHDAAAVNQDGDDHAVPEEFLYWLADANAPQTFLGPMLAHATGEHRDISPASMHTLQIDMLQRTAGSRMEIHALVEGGSGRYEYQWGRWTPGGFFPDGITMLGTSQTIAVDRGAYQIVLGVKDRVTGAVAMTERAVFPKSD